MSALRLLIFLLFSFSISLTGQLTADFTLAKTTGCAPFIVKPSELSTGSPISWTWSSTAGVSSNKQNPTLIFPNAGVFDITLEVNDGSSTASKTLSIRVFPNLSADFSAANPKGCAPHSTEFYDLSVPQSSVITDWFWSFGNGETSTEQYPNTNYTEGGTYEVLLKITDNNGCEATALKSSVVEVEAPIADFLFDSITCRVPANINFLNTSEGKNLNYFWDFGNGNTSTSQIPPTQLYPKVDTIPIKLRIEEQGGTCKDSVTKMLYLKEYKVDFEVDIACADTNFTVALTDLTQPTPISLRWDLGDGTDDISSSVVHSYPNNLKRTITLEAYASPSCVNTKSFTYTPPFASFSMNIPSSCVTPFVVDFTNTSTGNNLIYFWNLRDSTTSISRDTSCSYPITSGSFTPYLEVTDSMGCTKSLSQAFALPFPISDFTTKDNTISGCAPLTIEFIDSSTVPSAVASWQWDFGDGSPVSNAPNPTHTYTNVGKYDVTLIILLTNGCVDTIVKQEYIKVGELPLSADFSFGADSICFGQSLNFSPTSTYSQLTYTADYHCWLFEKDQGTALLTSNDKSHNDCPPSYTAYKTQDTVVNALSPAHLFENSKYKGIANYLGYNYIGTTDPSAGHLYTHLITGFNGCYSETIKPVYVHPTVAMPGFAFKNLNFSLVECDSSETLLLYNASVNYDSLVYYRVIHLPTNDTVLTLNATDTVPYTFNQVGDYKIEIAVYNTTSACEDVTERIFQVIDYPIEISTLNNPCKGEEIVAVDKNLGGYALQERAWYFNNALESAEAFPSVTNDTLKTSKGSFGWNYIDLTRLVKIEDNLLGNIPLQQACRFNVRDSIFLEGTDLAVIADTLVACAGDSIKLKSVVTAQSPVDSYSWSLNDTSTLNGPIDSVYFSSMAVGNYVVKLKTISQFGCIDSVLSQNLIVSKPQIEFLASDTVICANEIVTFKNWSKANNGLYTWYIDGTTITNIDALYQFNGVGTYDIKLVGVDHYGCSDSLTKIDYVGTSDFPEAAFEALQLIANCPPFSIQFQDTSATPGTKWQWNISDGGTSNKQNYLHTFINAGSYDVQLITENDIGCEDTLSKPNYITIKGPSATAVLNQDTVCAPDSVKFYMNFTDAVYYVWDFKDGNVVSGEVNSPTDSVSHYYQKGKLYQPQLTVIDTNDCSVRYDQLVPLTVDSIQAIFRGASIAGCSIDSVLFINTSKNAFPASYQWEFGDGNNSSDSIGMNSYLNPGSYLVKLRMESPIGCKDSMELNYDIYVAPDERLQLSSQGFCVPVQMDYVLAYGNSGFNPDYAEIVFNGTQYIGDSMSQSITNPGTYNIAYRLEYGNGACFIDSAFTHTYYEAPKADFDYKPKNVSLTDASISFDNLSTESVSYEWRLGDGSVLFTEDANYEYNEAGDYDVLLIANNAGNCPDTAIKRISIAPYDFIYLPQAFSPNGDGLNDEFGVLAAGDVTIVSFEIYNRWGNQVFRTVDAEEKWDGTIDGKEAISDTYVYYVRGRTKENEVVEYKGDFLLVR